MNDEDQRGESATATPAPSDLEAEQATGNTMRVGLLIISLLATGAAGFFATIALGITPNDFAPKFTGTKQHLMSSDFGGGYEYGYINVYVEKDTDVPPGWWCFNQDTLTAAGAENTNVPAGNLVCLVPNVYADADTWTDAQANADRIAGKVSTPQPAEEPAQEKEGTNWAAWIAALLTFIGAVTAALTQHEKFPWSAASKLARKKAERELARMPTGSPRNRTKGSS